MRKIIDIINEAQSSFQLHPELDPSKYVMTSSLKDVNRWKAYCYVGNNGDDNLHQMMDTGYIMISLSTNYIIPIARDDEHHTGVDLLYDFVSGEADGKKRKIDISDFYPIWSKGNNYIFHEEDIEPLYKAAKKYLSYGGYDGPLKGSNNYRGITMHLSDFVNNGGKLELSPPGKLAPIGNRVYEILKELSDELTPLLGSSDRIKNMKVFNKTLAMLKYFIPLSYELGIDVKDRVAELKTLQKNNDMDGLEELVFGFRGIKNEIHIAIKKAYKAGKKDYSYQIFSEVWGDLELANAMLARM